MKPLLSATLLSLCLLAHGPVGAEDAPAKGPGIEISHQAARPTGNAPAANFTGTVHLEPLLAPHPGSRVSIGNVTFEPGARSAWHTHPAGQILIVTAGVGWIQQWGAPVEEMRQGDVVWISPGVKHWHGASATAGMTHIAVQEVVDGRNVDWLEPVGADQYHR